MSEDRTEAEALSLAALEGTLSPRDAERLNALLTESEEARRHYLQLAGLTSSLHWYATELQSEAPPAAKVVAFPRLRRAWPYLAGGLAAAAGLVVGLWLSDTELSLPGDRRSETTAVGMAGDTVACIVSSKDGVWKTGAHQPGDPVSAGTQLELTSGFVQIEFDSGASVTLEGPASLAVANAWEARLDRGALRATVPVESAGFRVSSAAVVVVDLGTEFSMLADAAGGAEVFALEGSIEATPRGVLRGERMLLREKESRHFGAGGVAEVPDRERKLARFARRVAWDRSLTPPRYLQWSFAAGDSALSPSRANGLPPLRLPGAPPAAEPGGPWGAVLPLAPGDRRQATASSWPRQAGGTVACWVRLPAGESMAQGQSFLAWKCAGPLALDLALSCNQDPRRGVLGALQTDLARGFRTGNTSLRDGRWHHLAVAYAVAENGRRYQVKQYVDGRLEAASAQRNPKRRLLERGAPGASLTLSAPSATPGAALDELVLADRVLTQREIRRLMETNSLAPAAALY